LEQAFEFYPGRESKRGTAKGQYDCAKLKVPRPYGKDGKVVSAGEFKDDPSPVDCQSLSGPRKNMARLEPIEYRGGR
jgi:hypothetical protein